MRLPAGYHAVAWTEVGRNKAGNLVFMRRGTGETGWWHDHQDGTDYGGNPMDYRDQSRREFVCRECGHSVSAADLSEIRSRLLSGGSDASG